MLLAIIRMLKEKISKRDYIIRNFKATAEKDEKLHQDMNSRLREYEDLLENYREEARIEKENNVNLMVEKAMIEEENLKKANNTNKNSTFMLSPNAMLNGSKLSRIRD